MINNYTVYEQPLNERIRTFLRLEELFKQNEFSLAHSSHWSTRSAVSSLIEILNIFERIDIKNDTIKELERLEKRSNDTQSTAICQYIQQLQSIPGKIGSHLRDVQLIAMVRQRSEIPGGTFNFDIPMYHFWLETLPEPRHNQLKIWMNDFQPIKHANNLILSLIRDNGTVESEIAENGFFQKSLESLNPCQMIRVFLRPGLNVFPEISGSKHRVSIRFLQPNLSERSSQTTANVMFDLSIPV